MIMDAETGMISPQAQECRWSLEAQSGKEGLPSRTSKVTAALLTPGFQPSDTYWSSGVLANTFLLSCWGCGHLLRQQWHPIPVPLPGKSHGRRSLVGCSPWGREESDTTERLALFTLMHWRRKWQPTPVFVPEESQGRGSLVGCRLWGRTESDTTEVT